MIVGTRPEAIKLAPVYRALDRAGMRPVAVLTGQHEELLDPLIKLFGLERRIDLAARKPGDTLTSFAARCIQRLGDLLAEQPFDLVMVQGDTTSALAGAIAASYAGIPLAHVEAGLRSGDLGNPFPEELNRRMIAETARWHFAPTPGAAGNLRAERREGEIHVVGNTVVDSALWVASHDDARGKLGETFEFAGPHVLVTAHRRESFGAPMEAIADAVALLAQRHTEITFVVPLHPNPHASAPIADRLARMENVHLTEPLSYPLAIGLLAGASMVLTDSGGLQEEAPCFGVPVLVLRDVTERPEGVAAGWSRIAGTTTEGIVSAFEQWRHEGFTPPAINPYGDGFSGERISEILLGEVAAIRMAC